MDKCKEEYRHWRDMFESDYDTKPTPFHAWQARQSEIDALKAQVEELKKKLNNLQGLFNGDYT